MLTEAGRKGGQEFLSPLLDFTSEQIGSVHNRVSVLVETDGPRLASQPANVVTTLTTNRIDDVDRVGVGTLVGVIGGDEDPIRVGAIRQVARIHRHADSLAGTGEDYKRRRGIDGEPTRVVLLRKTGDL